MLNAFAIPQITRQIMMSLAFAVCSLSALALDITSQASVDIKLVTGWNLIGNSANMSWNVSELLGDKTKVTTVWKWMADGARWAFYAPSLNGQALLNYANNKGYDVLTTVGPGEGIWVNAQTDTTLSAPSGSAFNSTNFQNHPQVWSLIATGDNLSPARFNAILGVTPPSTSEVAGNLTSLWAWDASLAKWYFYAPSLDANSSLTTYTASKGYLDFAGKTLNQGLGFWINKAVPPSGVNPQKAADGLWFGTFYNAQDQVTYTLCQGQGDMISTADGWITVFLHTNASCAGAGLMAYVRFPYSIDTAYNISVLSGGIIIKMDANEMPVSISKLPTGSGSASAPTALNRSMTVNLVDGSVLSVVLDANTTAPKSLVVQDFSQTQGQYLGRSNSDVVGTRFTIAADGSMSGTLVFVPLFASANAAPDTCDIQSATKVLQPGYAGYYLIKSMALTCISAKGESYNKIVNGYAIPVHSSGVSYGARESVVGSSNAASIFLSIFDSLDFTRLPLFVSDNLVLQ